ncbi:EscU/YscU/HrcU family type III secretion system export apparatus switch protein [Planctomycetota bacterium]
MDAGGENLKAEKNLSRQLVVALKYDVEEDPAPAIVAKGRGEVARRILDLARQHNIPIEEDHALADALGQLDLGDFIPEEMFPAVAEVLAFIFRMEKNYNI